MPDEIYLWFIGQLVVAAAIYGGIRIDIKNIHTNIGLLNESVTDVHKRVDRLLERNHQ